MMKPLKIFNEMKGFGKRLKFISGSKLLFGVYYEVVNDVLPLGSDKKLYLQLHTFMRDCDIIIIEQYYLKEVIT